MPITFKTEEERAEALSKISSDPADAPVGVKIEDFMQQNEDKLDEIMDAEIKPDEEPDPNKGDGSDSDSIPSLEPDKNPAATPNPAQATKPKPDDGDGRTPDDTDVARLQRRNEALQEQRDQLMADHSNDISKLQQQIDDLRKSKPSPSDGKTDDDSLPIDTEISVVQNEIKALEDFMNNGEVDVFDEESVKKMRKLNMLSIKLTGLVSKRSQQIIKLQQDEINDIKKTQKVERDNEQRKNNRKTMFKTIEQFRESVPELQGRAYADMDAEYTDFGREIASLWFDIPISKVTPENVEVAVNKYVKKVPELMERVYAKGLQAPKDLEKYVIISDVHALRMGFVLDKRTGEWKQMTDSRGKNVVFPSLKAAWNHYKEENTLPKANKVDKENKSAKGIIDAITKRANAVELDGSHKETDIVEMSKDNAQNIVAKYSEEYISLIARKNFDNPIVTEYNKALKALDMATLDREDFE